MKELSRHAHTVRLACGSALLMALAACAGGPAGQQGNLDLGGGISMTPEGEILGATPAQPSNFAESDYTFESTRVALPAAAPDLRNMGNAK